jgi:DNA polymerase III epsilon subunit-like protein
VVNFQGLIVIDTLVSQDPKPDHRQVKIHGITDTMLNGAPSLHEVQEHLQKITDGKEVIYIGHNVLIDLKVL